MTRWWAAASVALLLGGCGGKGDGNASVAQPQAGPTVSTSAIFDAVRPAATSPAPAAAARSFPGRLDAPSDLDVVMVYFDHLGSPPPIERWVDGDYAVRSADEFRKEALRKEKVASLQSQFDHDKGIGAIKLVSSSGLGEYSKEYHEFHLAALAPGRSYVFEHDGVRVSLALTNAADFYRLPMDEGLARKLADRFGGRSVRMEIDVRLDDARPDGDGGALGGHIAGLRVLTADGTEISSKD